MKLRSLEVLDTDLAWRRTLFAARQPALGIPDRLPFEVTERLGLGPGLLEDEHHLDRVVLVMATKGTGTVRPFVRIAPADLLLYQALVDRLASSIEHALPARDRVFGFRQSLKSVDYPFDGTTTWSDFIARVRSVATNGSGYALKADVAGYFLYVDVDELERRLLEVVEHRSSARDLGALLRGWNALDVHGLPQGTAPSSPLANFYLNSLDDMLERAHLDYARYVDDVWVFTDSYSEARRVQDHIERHLYDLGLALAAEKSKIMRFETVLEDTEAARAAIERRKASYREAAEDQIEETYAGDIYLPDPDEVNTAAVLAEFEDVMSQLRAGRYPEATRAKLKEIFRELEAVGRNDAVEDFNEILVRCPDLAGPTASYAARTCQDDPEPAVRAFVKELRSGRFHREQEKLELCRGALLLPPDVSTTLAAEFGAWALNDEHPVVRARALLVWGAQSARNDFSIADAFWQSTHDMWRMYGLVSIQAKHKRERDRRLRQWGGESRVLGRLAESVLHEPLDWTIV